MSLRVGCLTMRPTRAFSSRASQSRSAGRVRASRDASTGRMFFDLAFTEISSPAVTWKLGTSHDPAVDLDVTMTDQLTRLAPTLGEAHPENDVVQAALERDQQVLTRDARDVVRVLEEVPELLLVKPIDSLHLLLLTQLHRVVRLLAATLLRGAVLTWRVRASLDGTLLGVALLSLQEELLAFAAAEPADGSCIARHLRPDASSEAGIRCAAAASRPEST